MPMDSSQSNVQGVWDPALAQAYLAAIVESSDDAIIAKNLEGIIQCQSGDAATLWVYAR